MQKALSIKWKLKQFLKVKNNLMDESFLSLLSNNFKHLFNFLKNYGYLLFKNEMITDEEFKLTYLNKENGKEIYISLCDSSNTQRLFIIIAIIRIPHEVVHDYISFEVYLNKNNIQHPEPLEAREKNLENANVYIETYANLFKQYGTELITSNKQFPHYFPEWT